MSTSPVVPISYKNTSREAIPSFACVQLSGDSVQNGTTGARSVCVGKPDGTGPYAIDVGTGSSSSGDGQYSLCVVPMSHTWWVKYNGSSAPAEAWVTEVGPVSGQWYMDSTGSGYIYAGAFDSTNGIILVMQKSSSGGGYPLVHFSILTVDCYTSTATAVVDNVPCSCTSVSIGDVIDLVDLYGHFDGEAVLVGRGGWAIRMEESGGYGCGWVIQSLDPESFRC